LGDLSNIGAAARLSDTRGATGLGDIDLLPTEPNNFSGDTGVTLVETLGEVAEARAGDLGVPCKNSSTETGIKLELEVPAGGFAKISEAPVGAGNKLPTGDLEIEVGGTIIV
jgi:hypothetical protein